MSYLQETFQIPPIPQVLQNGHGSYQDVRKGLATYLNQLQKFLYDFHNTTVNNANNAMQGAGASIPSAPTITISKSIHTVTGQATISQINAPKGFQGGLILIAQDGFTLQTGGNIKMLQPQNAVDPNANVHLTFHPNINAWVADTCRLRSPGPVTGGLYLSGTTVVNTFPAKVITPAQSPYTIQAGDFFLKAKSGAVTINLPASNGPNQNGISVVFVVKNMTGGSLITITPNGSDTIDLQPNVQFGQAASINLIDADLGDWSLY